MEYLLKILDFWKPQEPDNVYYLLLFILFAPNPYSCSLSKEMKTISLQRHEIYVIVGS
jgi:hypothetical protein